MKVYGIDGNNKKLEYTAVMTFKGTQHFVVYTDMTVDKNGNLKLYSAVYDPSTSLLIREPSNKHELEEIKEAIRTYFIDIK